MWPWCGKRRHKFIACDGWFLSLFSWVGKWLQIKNIDFFSSEIDTVAFSIQPHTLSYSCIRFDIPKSNQHLIRRAQIVRKFNTVRIHAAKVPTFWLQSLCIPLSMRLSQTTNVNERKFVWNHKLTMSQRSHEWTDLMEVRKRKHFIVFCPVT